MTITPSEYRRLRQRVALLEQTVTHLYQTLELQCAVNDATDQRLSSLYKLVLLLSGSDAEGKPAIAPPEILH